MFEIGFLGTRAPLYMDIVTIFFALLPLLLFFSIRFAIKKDIKKHYISQIITYLTTLVMVVVFEIGVRVDGGYLKYVQESSVNLSFLNTFLIIHIIIATLSVIAWSILLVNSYKSYKKELIFNATTHKKRAKIVTLALVLTSFMGVGMYYFLFV